MDQAHLGPLPAFNRIGFSEAFNVLRALRSPLSGYLGGVHKSGYWCSRLESEWCLTFNTRFAVPCNSATSGLLAACMAARVGPGDEVWVSPYTMSATAAVAIVLGAKIKFIDIERVRYSINMRNFPARSNPKAIIVTNIFGHPAYLHALRLWCDSNKVVMIEDNAQSAFAMENGKYAGTIGHMGVWSLNVHKQMQSGEGGVITTEDPYFSFQLRNAINHGELYSGLAPDIPIIGLNLRMTEPVAAIACAQLKKGPSIIAEKRELSEEITDMFSQVRHYVLPHDDIGCRHSYYVWAGRFPNRDALVAALQKRGFPIHAGYATILTTVFDPSQLCPEAERIDKDIVTYEMCAYRPRKKHLRLMREIIKQVC